MTFDADTVTAAAAVTGGISGPLWWIGRSLARIVTEVKSTAMIVRTCPGCAETARKMDEANEHTL